MEPTSQINSGAPMELSMRHDAHPMFSSNSYEDDDSSLSPSAAGTSSEAGANDHGLADHFRPLNMFQSAMDFHQHHMSSTQIQYCSRNEPQLTEYVFSSSAGSSSSAQVMDPNAMHIMQSDTSHYLGSHDGGDVACTHSQS
jgi:hypothetical protein